MFPTLHGLKHSLYIIPIFISLFVPLVFPPKTNSKGKKGTRKMELRE